MSQIGPPDGISSGPDADPDVTTVLTAYAAFARGDIDHAVSVLHPEVEWIEPEEFPDGGRRVGPAAVADYLRRSRSRWDVLRSEPAAYRHGDQIVVFHRVRGRLADGTSHHDTVADVYTLRHGKVVRMRAYADPAQALSSCPWRSSAACRAWCWS